LELQGNDDTSETETCVTMEVETEVQNKKIDPEGLEEQPKKMKATSSKKFQKPTLGQNVRIKIPDIDRAKMDSRSIIAAITDITDEEFY